MGKSKISERVLDILCEEPVREFLSWLLLICLTIEEYLIRILIEE